MALGILATKVGMTQIFTEEGVRIAVTVLRSKDNVIVQKRTNDVDGYTALQIGYGDKREKLVDKPMTGHYKKAGVAPNAMLREFRVDDETAGKYEVGTNLPFEMLEDVKSVDIAGVSKGKGFAGVMKRHNMKGFRATHGTHEYFRHGGSIGCRAVPGRVFKGKRMGGQMGNERVRMVNMSIEGLSPDEKLIFIRGSVPGGKGSVVELYPSSHTAKVGKGLTEKAQDKSRNPMKVSKSGR